LLDRIRGRQQRTFPRPGCLQRTAPFRTTSKVASQLWRGHKQQNGQWGMFCSLVRIWSVSVAEQHDCVHEPGATLWITPRT
jgi:hypothetical protein